MATTIDARFHLGEAPEDVFAFIADCENERPWNPELIDIRRLDGGPIGVGSEWDGDYKGMGSMRIRIEEYEPSSHITFRTTGSRMDMRFTFDLTPAADAGSDIAVHADMEPRGVMRVMSPLLGPMMRRTLSRRPAQMADGLAQWKAARAAPHQQAS